MTTSSSGHRVAATMLSVMLAQAACAPLPSREAMPAERPDYAAPALHAAASPDATPPPAAPVASPRAEGLEEIVVTASRREGRAAGVGREPGRRRPPVRSDRPTHVAASPVVLPPDVAGVPPSVEHLPHESAPASITRQSGQLTAGDHDDLLNAQSYQDYAERFVERHGRQDLPVLDTGARLQVTVRDAAGRPAPNIAVEARGAGGGRLTLATKSDGKIVLFPDFDRLGRRVELSVDGQPSQIVRLSPNGRPADVTLTLSAQAPPVRALDIVLVMDTTGSMGDELSYLTAEMADILNRVSRRYSGLDVRTGLVFYRDLGDDYTVRTYPFTGAPSVVARNLAHQQAHGGGDLPEAMHTALAEATAYDWRNDAVKILLLVADAPPHRADMAAAWSAGLAARGKNIQVVSIAASGVEDDAQYLMRAISAATQGRYVFITDDSGIGNAHAEPTVDCYVVTRLNGLISRVLSSLVAGERVEPRPEDVERRVGRYDRGVCKPR